MRYRVGIETRTRILDATRQLVSEAGLEGTTIKGICSRAGILAGSFYNLFSSKEEAVLVVIREAIQMVEPDPDATADLETLVDAYVRFFEEQEALARVYMLVAVGGGVRDESLRARLLRHHERRVERFTEAYAATGAAQPEEMAELMVTSLNGLALHRILDPKFDFATHARQLSRALSP